MSEQNQSLEKWQVTLLRVEHLYKNGMSIANSCKTVGVSVHTYYNWRRKPQTTNEIINCSNISDRIASE